MAKKKAAVAGTLVTAEPKALQVAQPAAPDMSPMAIMERLAKDPTVDVGKLQAIVELQKDINREKARAQFDAAFARMQPELPVIRKRGEKKGNEKDDQGRKTKVVQSRYARLGEDILPAIMPILGKHGFTLRHRTEWPDDRRGVIRVVGLLSAFGHQETSIFEAPMDRSDFRTDIQSMGSTISYGRRYTTVDLLNLIQQGVDDDGASGQTRQPEPPPPAPPKREAPVSSEADGEKPITQGTKDRPGQLERLFQARTRSGRTVAEVSTWLAARFGVKEAAQIKRKDYNYVVTCIEHPGPLPLEDRTPGEEG